MDNLELVNLADRAFSETERVNASQNWEEQAEFILPAQSGIFMGEEPLGIKKTRRTFDPIGIQASQDLAAAMHATLTNPATKWSGLRHKSEDLNNNSDATSWLQEVNKIIHLEFNESNFDTAVSKNYQMLTGLGTMILFQESKYNSAGIFEGFRFEAVHLAEVAIEENKDGIVDALYRKQKLTGKQLVEKFPNIQDMDVHNKPLDYFEVYHIVRPNSKGRIKQGLTSAENRPYLSHYVLKKDGQVLDTDGYYDFPFFVTRWQTMPGERYGRGPGHIAISSIRSLNKLDELELKTLDRVAGPVMFAEQEAIISSISLKPNTLNIVRSIDGIKEFQSNARFDVVQMKAEDIKNDIRSIFFIDKLFLPPRTETGEMTAFEVDQRLAQMQRVLGPTISRLNSEFLSPLIIRTFKTLLREGALPELPPILEDRGVDIEINFVNQLSKAQQIEELTTVDGFVRRMAEIAQFKPEALDMINSDEYVKFAGKILNVPEQLINNDDEVQQIRQQRAEAQQAQQALEAGVAAADIESKTS